MTKNIGNSKNKKVSYARLSFKKKSVRDSKEEIWKELLLLFAMIVIFLLPDVIFSIFDENFKLSHDPKVIFLLIPLSIGLIYNKFSWLSYFLITILCVFQIMQFSSLIYFKNLLSPYAVYLFLREIHDTFQEVSNVFLRYGCIVPMILLPFCGIAYCVKKSRRKSLFGTIVLLISFSFCGYQYFNTINPRFTPNSLRFTINNSLKAFWGWVVIECKKFPVKNYKPYKVISLNREFTEPITIVYIIGESANYRHMSLFGYEKNTTPKLIELSHLPNVYVTKGISGAISTISSCKFIMNLLREPNNPMQAASDATNLFKLAKNRGFKTFYLSNQSEHLISSLGGANYIDVVYTSDQNPIESAQINDDVLLKLAKNQKFSRRNFIVLHQRCIHTPYAKAISKNFNITEKFSDNSDPMINDYDNSMLYNDHIIFELFNYLSQQFEGKFYIFWASDHNEPLGENGVFGHGHGTLKPVTAEIPVIIQSNDEEFLKNFREIFRPNHYEIAESIARLLGYEIQNPNEEKDVFYICGIDFNGKCGYMKYQKNSAAHMLEYVEEH